MLKKISVNGNKNILIIFPHFGGLIESFQNIFDFNNIDVFFMDSDEEVYQFRTWSECIIDELDRIDKNIYFYGHCLGGELATSLAYEMEKKYNLFIRRLFIGASPPPLLKNSVFIGFNGFLNMKPDDIPARLIEFVLRTVETPKIFMENQKWKEAIIKKMKMDIILATTNPYGCTEYKLSCPIRVFYGERDCINSKEYFEPWKQYSNDVSINEIEGAGHLFFQEASFNIVKEIIRKDII